MFAEAVKTLETSLQGLSLLSRSLSLSLSLSPFLSVSFSHSHTHTHTHTHASPILTTDPTELVPSSLPSVVIGETLERFYVVTEVMVCVCVRERERA